MHVRALSNCRSRLILYRPASYWVHCKCKWSIFHKVYFSNPICSRAFYRRSFPSFFSTWNSQNTNLNCCVLINVILNSLKWLFLFSWTLCTRMVLLTFQTVLSTFFWHWRRWPVNQILMPTTESFFLDLTATSTFLH